MMFSFLDQSWKSVQELGELQYAVLDAEDIRTEYSKEFSSKMELVQGMFELARAHRAYDQADHPALKKVKEEKLRLMEEDWESKRDKQMEKVREKQKQWQESPDIDVFEEEEEEEEDDNIDADEFFDHDEL